MARGEVVEIITARAYRFDLAMALAPINSSLPKPPQGRVRKRRGLPGWILPIGLLFAFVAVVLGMFWDLLQPVVEVRVVLPVTVRAEAEATPVSTASDEIRTKTLAFQASGWLEPDPYPVIVPTLVAGTVTKVHVLEGQEVKEGQLLAELDSDDAELALRAAEARLDRLRAEIAAHCSTVPALIEEQKAAREMIRAKEARLADAGQILRRLKQVPEGTVPSRELDSAQQVVEENEATLQASVTEVARLQARIDQIDYERNAMGTRFLEAEIARDQAKLALNRHTITSPMAGRVLHLHVRPGQKVARAGTGEKAGAVLDLYDPQHLQARIDVPLNEAAGLEVGQEVEMSSDLLKDVVLKGVVTRLVGEADLQRNTLQAKVSVEVADPRLRPGMLVRGKFFSAKSAVAASSYQKSAVDSRFQIFVLERALIKTGDRRARSYVVGADGEVEVRDLELGRAGPKDYRQVVSGLLSGEPVILPPHDQLAEGKKVRVVSEIKN